ncbi:hypothetical protein [Streptomyces sp. SYSU K217416]
MTAPTVEEERLTAAYGTLLARVSACSQALQGGSWVYLAAKAREAAQAAEDVEASVNRAMASGAGSTTDPSRIVATVVERARTDTRTVERAVQALHPQVQPHG